ncbi:DUF6993 domain-containing protein [Microbacterium sp. NPDC055665]
MSVFATTFATVAVLVSGCAAGLSTPSASSAPVPSAAPVLQPDGTAGENLAYFAGIVDEVWGGPAHAVSRAYVDALTDAGFNRSDMQITADLSTVGNPAESIQFSVRWGEGECLVGQVGPSTGTPIAMVLPQLADGACLIGVTPALDGDQE